MSKRRWKGLYKTAEECSELIQELMKLHSYPDGKHPRRRRNLALSVQEEAADVLASLTYFLIRNKLDKSLIDKRVASKIKKFEKRWGSITPKKKPSKKKVKRQAKKEAKTLLMQSTPEISTPPQEAPPAT